MPRSILGLTARRRTDTKHPWPRSDGNEAKQWNIQNRRQWQVLRRNKQTWKGERRRGRGLGPLEPVGRVSFPAISVNTGTWTQRRSEAFGGRWQSLQGGHDFWGGFWGTRGHPSPVNTAQKGLRCWEGGRGFVQLDNSTGRSSVSRGKGSQKDFSATRRRVDFMLRAMGIQQEFSDCKVRCSEWRGGDPKGRPGEEGRMTVQRPRCIYCPGHQGQGTCPWHLTKQDSWLPRQAVLPLQCLHTWTTQESASKGQWDGGSLSNTWETFTFCSRIHN